MTIRAIFALFVIILSSALACSGFRPSNPDPRGILRFTGEPKQTHIEIDDVSLGPLHMFEKDGVLLRPGEHRIIASAQGFFTEYLEVEIKAEQTTTLKIKLRPVPD